MNTIRMTNIQRENCTRIINKAALFSLVTGILPTFVLDTGVMYIIHMQMIDAIGKEMNIPSEQIYTSDIVRNSVTNNLGKFVLSEIAELMPVVGCIINGGLNYSVTKRIGWEIADKFSRM